MSLNKRKSELEKGQLDEDAFRRICCIPASAFDLHGTLTMEWDPVFAYVMENDVGEKWKHLAQERILVLEVNSSFPIDQRSLAVSLPIDQKSLVESNAFY